MLGEARARSPRSQKTVKGPKLVFCDERQRAARKAVIVRDVFKGEGREREPPLVRLQLDLGQNEPTQRPMKLVN